MKHDRVVKELPAVNVKPIKAVKEPELYKCIKGMADKEDANVICMQGDLVEVLEINEGEILVEGYQGWCEGCEICFTPSQFVNHFESF